MESFKHLPLDQSGYVVDENTWSDKLIISSLLEARATEITIALSQKLPLSDLMVQTLRCVNLNRVDRSEGLDDSSGCYWLKTDRAIPKFIKAISVTGKVANGDNPRFTFIKWDRFQYIPQARNSFMANARYWTVREIPGEGPYIYLYNDDFLDSISISGLWENPMEVEAFPVCGEENLKAKCFPLDVDFYTDPWMRDIIISKTWQKLLPVREGAPEDKRNDDKHTDSRRVRI